MRELSPVPLSIITPNRSVSREASRKSDFCKILQGMKWLSESAPYQPEWDVLLSTGWWLFNLWPMPLVQRKDVWRVVWQVSDKCTRVDVVLDLYLPNSVKEGTRSKRKGWMSRGIKRNVESRQHKVGNWDKAIFLENNKASLAHFFSYMQMSQSYNARPCREQVVSGGFSDILMYGHLICQGRTLKGWLLKAVTLGNVSSNLSRNFVATQVARKIA